MDDEPEMYIVDFSNTGAAAEYRQQVEQARAEARHRYHDYLAAAFDVHGCTDPGALADVALGRDVRWCPGCGIKLS